MTTTAHEDQFTVGTQTIELVRQPYDTVAILKRNVADLEVALRTQTERAEAAEAELEAVREDNHSMMLEIHNLRTERDELAVQKSGLAGRILHMLEGVYGDNVVGDRALNEARTMLQAENDRLDATPGA